MCQVVSERLGPVFERVGGGVCGDVEFGVPASVGRIVRGERVGVVDLGVAEQCAELGEVVGLGDEPVEVVVAGFVAEVTDHCPERFAEFTPDVFAVSFVGFGQIERDDPGAVSGRDTTVVEVHEIEPQAIGLLWRMDVDCELQVVELVNQPSLGGFGRRPGRNGVGSGIVGAAACQPTRPAPHVAAVGGEHPVAPVGRVEAPPQHLTRPGDVVGDVVDRHQGPHAEFVGKIPK